jgi:ANTAR domain-containing protein
MTSRNSNRGDAARRHDRERSEAAVPTDQPWRPARRPGRHAAQGPPDQGRGQPGRAGASAASRASGEPRSAALGAEPVARRTATGWRVGDEEVSDLTSAMVLADLLAADLPGPGTPPAPAATAPSGDEPPDARRLEQTVAQLEHALTARVRVEQAIGVLAERHRLRPRQAFELLRSVARAQGRRVLEMATEVVDSATNPLLRIPEELAKPPLPRRRSRVRAGWQPEQS